MPRSELLAAGPTITRQKSLPWVVCFLTVDVNDAPVYKARGITATSIEERQRTEGDNNDI